jgi:hypothetical protein
MLQIRGRWNLELVARRRWKSREIALEDHMGKLVVTSRFANPDAAYVALVEARRGLSDEAAAALDARLLLILANHIGDLDVLREAIALAKDVKEL